MDFSLQLSYIFILINRLHSLNIAFLAGLWEGAKETCEIVGGGIVKNNELQSKFLESKYFCYNNVRIFHKNLCPSTKTTVLN